jgi:nucleotide sugar dehydrogenase
MKDYSIVVVGLGYVGLTYSMYLAKRGIKVYGIEKNERTCTILKSGNMTFYEEGIDEILTMAIQENMFEVFSTEEFAIKRAELGSCLFVVTVGTPVEQDTKILNKESLNAVFASLNTWVEHKDAISLRSTVPLGTTKEFCAKIDKDIHYCFAPERTIEGKAIHELETLPQVYGANSKASKTFFKEMFAYLNNETVEVNTSEHAEMVKLVSNVSRDVNFAFSNEVAFIASKFGLNSKQVIDAVNYNYPRANVSSPGPVAGPCLSKDSYILFDNLPDSYKKHSLILNSRKLNEEVIVNAIGDLLKEQFTGRKVKCCILGVAFKGHPSTGDVRDSYALRIADYLKKQDNVELSAYDNVVKEQDFIDNGLNRELTLEAAFRGKDFIIIQNNHEIFKRINVYSMIQLMNDNGLVFDLWSIHPEKTYNNQVAYLNF